MNASVFPDRHTGHVETAPVVRPETGATAVSLSREANSFHQVVQALHEEIRPVRRRAIGDALEERAQQTLRKLPVDVLTALRAEGMTWRDIAKVTGVSVPAVRKWRLGEGMARANQGTLARLAALIGLLREEHLLPDPAGWLDTPVHTGVAISKFDLLAAGRFDLVIELAADDQDGHDSEAVLEEFCPEWRDRYLDEMFEVVVARDGLPLIRPRR